MKKDNNWSLNNNNNNNNNTATTTTTTTTTTTKCSLWNTHWNVGIVI